ncbi:MAG TPA: EscU/YscU/HrcU family type III secretion system export apparatus switch protein [Solirubrobacteraceae bacterium]|jgi:flagellar biosynthetic protein FlhB
MAKDERTEKPTAKHRDSARKKGQVARSPDVGGSLSLLAGLFAISLVAPRVVEASTSALRQILGDIAHPDAATSAAGLKGLLDTALSTFTLAVGPIAAVCLGAGVLAGAAQVGVRPRGMKLDFSRINPAKGVRSLIGPNLIFEAVKAIAKVAVVGVVTGLALIPGLQGLASLVGIAPIALGTLIGSRAMSIAQHAAFAYLVIAALDYAWKRRQHEQQLKMTKHQVKDEARQYGVSGEVKAALRRRQMQAARARMMTAVPDADVVVTNPTHYAVALRYDGSRTAPEVLAKGQDLIAAQIKRVAIEHDVPVISDPPLARALHRATEIGQVIPQELYAAVAQVLAFVYRLTNRRRMLAR